MLEPVLPETPRHHTSRPRDTPVSICNRTLGMFFPSPRSKSPSEDETVKVLIANKFFFRNGGSEAVMLQERDYLAAAGVDIIDFSMKDERNLPSDYAQHFVDNQSYASRSGAVAKLSSALKLIHSPEAVRKIGRLIDETQPGLVHCHNIYHQLTPSIIGAAKRRGVPVVLTLHDYKPICPVYTRLNDGEICSECMTSGSWRVLANRCADGSLSKSGLLLAETWLQRLLGSYEQVDKVITPSAFMYQAVTRRRFDADRVEVLYNGVDCESIRRAEHDEDYMLYLGRLSHEKGIQTLLAAHAPIADRIELRVAGTGPLEQAMRSAYPKARYLGHLSGDSLAATIRGASLIVVPSEWLENCPMSILEAMAFGKPVVASAVGGIPELVTSGETGLLFPMKDQAALRDCLISLMANPSLRRAYGDAARKRAEQHFSLRRHNQALLRLYHGVLESARAKRPSHLSTRISAPQE